MATILDDTARTQLLHRLKRAEGQLRGVQRMLQEGEPCLDIAAQLAAVRRALDSASTRMALCLLEQELAARLPLDARAEATVAEVLAQAQVLLGKLR